MVEPRSARDLHAGTVTTRHELARALVLAESFARHHPDAPPVAVLVLDGTPGDLPGAVAALDPDDLGLEPVEFRRLAALLGPDALAAAMRPWLLEALLDRGARPALYLEASMRVFARLDEVVAAHDLVVAPVVPDRAVAERVDRAASRLERVFDPGFLAAGDAARPLLRRWADWTQAAAEGVEDDFASEQQRWTDVALNAFGAHQVRDEGFVVGYWNVGARRVTDEDGRLSVDGHPVTLFHFRDFRPEEPFVLAPSAPPELGASARPDLAALGTDYAAALGAARRVDAAPPDGLDRLADGTPLDATMRALYRRALARWRVGEGPEPPSPFEHRGERFLAWLNEPVEPPTHPVVSRYLAQAWRDDEARSSMYFELVGETAERYLAWCASGADAELAPSVRPSLDDVARVHHARALRRPREPAAPGVNVVGYLRSASGLGEVGRSVGEALDAAGVQTAALDRAESLSPRHEAGPARAAGAVEELLDVNVVCITADLFPRFAREVGPDFFAGRRTAGLWFWEVESFPAAMLPAIDLVDEIWVPSEFVRGALAAHTTKPVVKVPVPIPCPEPTDADARAALPIPEDRFVFAFAFDFLSVAERKNPFGLVEAYRRAFGPDDGAFLVVKGVNGDQDVASLERLRYLAAGRPDISIVDRYLPAASQHALFEACDAYVSLHRSEGFGLTIGEAMAFGKPVVVTGYSGNLEFTSPENAYLVDWQPTRIGPGQGPYPAESRWADPDLDHAAHLMRSVLEDPAAARARGLVAREEIRRRWSLAAVAPALAAEAAATRARAPGSPATWRSFFMRGWRTVQNPEFRRSYEYDWLPDGTPVDDSVQRSLHAFLDEARAGRGLPPPNPDRVGGAAALRAWLNEPISPGLDPCLSRYFVQYWRDHPELTRLFPGVDQTPADAGAFVNWLRASWYEGSDVPYQFAPLPPPPPVPPLERAWTAAYQRARRLLSVR